MTGAGRTLDALKAAVEHVLDALVSNDFQVIAADESFTVRAAEGHVEAPGHDAALTQLRKLWTADPKRAFQVVADYDKARTRVRNARDVLAAGRVLLHCGESGVTASGHEAARTSIDAVRRLAQLRAEHRNRPQLVRRLIGNDAPPL